MAKNAPTPMVFRSTLLEQAAWSSMTTEQDSQSQELPNAFPPNVDEVTKLPSTAELSGSSSTPEVSAVGASKTMQYFVNQPPKFPSILPLGDGVSTGAIPAMESDPIFDPAVHLQIEPPESIISAEFVEFPFPLPESTKQRRDFSLGYSKPFRLLSDEGIRALDGVIKANERFAKSNDRIPKCLRGLGYRSQFVRDLNCDAQSIDLFSGMAGKALAPHGMAMNMSHVNFGRPVKRGEPPVIVDQWHVDSVDYVVIIIMADLSKITGGELQVLKKKGVRDDADFMANGVDASLEHLVETIKYPGIGHAIMVQGSQVLHRITPVIEALGPRISVVNSYMSRNVFDEDSTRYQTFKTDPEHISKVDFSRHTAWRVQGMMNYITEEVKWGTSKEELANLMRKGSELLERAARLVKDEEDDTLTFVKEKGVEKEFAKMRSRL